MTTLRWIIDPPADGVTNMARDDALLQCVGAGVSPATLRFYTWTPATISLGYFQTYAEFAALPPPAGRLAVVRRQTGGGAILHDLELTYSLALPLDHALLDGGNANRLYHHVHAAVATLLAGFDIPIDRGPENGGSCTHRGPFFCFERHSCFDLLAEGRKIMGSAQRRTTRAVLQHGSLILGRRFDQQSCAAVSDFADVDMNELLPELARNIAGDTIGSPTAFDAEEITLADQLRAKYADLTWTQRR